MRAVMDWLGSNATGLLVLVCIVLVSMLILLFGAWLFGWGRFARSESSAIRDEEREFIWTRFVVQIIDDFRHLLALVIVALFGVAMIAAIAYGFLNGGDAFVRAVQTVAASLSGLLGSVVGYYFGESAAKSRAVPEPPPSPPVDVPGPMTPPRAPPPQD